MTGVEARIARMDRAARAKQMAAEKEIEEAGQLVSRFVIARSECQNCSHTTATMRFYRAALGMTRQCPICRHRTLKLVARKERKRQ
ncbi:MAG: hypothetical protein KAY24_00325 [Candidatus Eisenbacteria sp.]|nr:hypothetical protein [Candidatus Eisenbacteria bacterium]